MPTINGKACVINGTPVDKVFSNGKQVYGRNLLINTSSSATNGKTSMQGSGPAIFGVYSRTNSYEQVIANYDPGDGKEFFYRFISPDTNNLNGLTPGTTYTLSGSASHTTFPLYFRYGYAINGGWIENVLDLGIPVSDGSVFKPFSETFTIPTLATGVYISLQIMDYVNGSLFRFKNMKLEKGTTATPWTPAPEDVGVTS